MQGWVCMQGHGILVDSFMTIMVAVWYQVAVLDQHVLAQRALAEHAGGP